MLSHTWHFAKGKADKRSIWKEQYYGWLCRSGGVLQVGGWVGLNIADTNDFKLC